MRILGIDPGLATVGFSIIDVDKAKMKLVTCGIISTPAHTSLSSRLDRIFDDLNELISTFSPDVMSIEELFFNTNITTGISVAHARGVILLAAYRAGVRVFEYTPLQVKQAVVGYGRAEKKQVIEMVKRILNLPSAQSPMMRPMLWLLPYAMPAAAPHYLAERKMKDCVLPFKRYSFGY